MMMHEIENLLRAIGWAMIVVATSIPDNPPHSPPARVLNGLISLIAMGMFLYYICQ